MLGLCLWDPPSDAGRYEDTPDSPTHFAHKLLHIGTSVHYVHQGHALLHIAVLMNRRLIAGFFSGRVGARGGLGKDVVFPTSKGPPPPHLVEIGQVTARPSTKQHTTTVQLLCYANPPRGFMRHIHVSVCTTVHSLPESCRTVHKKNSAVVGLSPLQLSSEIMLPSWTPKPCGCTSRQSQQPVARPRSACRTRLPPPR